MRSTLAARVSRLEASAKIGALPFVVFGEHGRQDHEIISIGNNGQRVVRGDDEALLVFISRANRVLRQSILFLGYCEGRTGDTCIVFPQFNPLPISR